MVGSLVSLFTLQVTHRIDADTDIERDHITWAFVSWLTNDGHLAFGGTLYSLALDVLILLALSSQSAAAYARRNERAGRLVRS